MNDKNNISPVRTIHQLFDIDGKPLPAQGTGALWVSKNCFGDETSGNRVEPLLTGEDYYCNLAACIESAETEILIAGWQINLDVQLTDSLRLYDALLQAATQKPALKIHVMPWKGSSAVPTFAHETKTVLEQINQKLERKQVFVCLSAAFAGMIFSHHQKHVVIDRKIAYVGGIDLAYGRRDDATYNLDPTSARRRGMDQYNGCIAQIGHINDNLALDVKEFEAMTTTGKGAIGPDWHRRKKAQGLLGNPASYQMPVGGVMHASHQPRMPWQDVHSRIEGPAVSDIAKNFIVRWNSSDGSPNLELPDPPSLYPKVGSCHVQVLRSACSKMVKEEKSSHTFETQDNILDAMIKLIDLAQHYIYLENQFFVSDFTEEGGYLKNEVPDLSSVSKALNTTVNKLKIFASGLVSPGDNNAPPTNSLVAKLGNKLHHIITSGTPHPFHIYITLPVHPEGPLNNSTITTQIHVTMQTLVHGKMSLLNQIRRSLMAKQLLDAGDPEWEKPFSDYRDTRYQNIPLEAVDEYVTLLNLRNFAVLQGQCVTEQIYIHSKTTIVDDLYAIIGSANINDRSLTGDGDSELAILVADDADSLVDITGNGKPNRTLNFARNLRMGMWNKIFGITGKIRPADLQSAVDQPGNPASWKAIQKQARANSKLYEQVFDFIPRSYLQNINPGFLPKTIASIWPVLPVANQIDAKDLVISIDKEQVASAEQHLPCHEVFWKIKKTGNYLALYDVKGFITALPLEWTKGENNHIPWDTSLLSFNEPVLNKRSSDQPALALSGTQESQKHV